MGTPTKAKVIRATDLLHPLHTNNPATARPLPANVNTNLLGSITSMQVQVFFNGGNSATAAGTGILPLFTTLTPTDAQSFGTSATGPFASNPQMQRILQQAQAYYLANVRYVTTTIGSTTIESMYIATTSSAPDGSLISTLPLNPNPVFGDARARRLSTEPSSGDGYVGFSVRSPVWGVSGQSVDINYAYGISDLNTLTNPAAEDIKLLSFAAYLWQNQSATISVTPYIPLGIDPNILQETQSLTTKFQSYNDMASQRVSNIQGRLGGWLNNTLIAPGLSLSGGFSNPFNRARSMPSLQTNKTNSYKVTLTID